MTEVIPSPDSLGQEWHSFVEKLDDPHMIARCLVLAGQTSVSLIRDELPVLYRALRRTTVARPAVSRRGLTGSPLWGLTVQQRTANGGDPSLYVVNSTARSSDVPENRGLVACLTYLSGLIATLARNRGERRLPQALQLVAQEARAGLRLPALRDLPAEPVLSVRSHAAMMRSRLTTFERIADLSLSLRNIEDAPKSEVVASLAAAGWLAPISDDDLFEIFVMTNVIQIISQEWGDPVKLNPIRMGEPIAIWNIGNKIRIRLNFNMTPQAMRNSSRYMRSSQNYNGVFNATSRRPDIIISVDREEKSLFTIVEVKNPSLDNSDYRRDSLYKCFGYLHDFGDVFENDETQDICFLVFPEKIPSNYAEQERVAVVSGDYGSDLRDRLRSRIQRAIDRVADAEPEASISLLSVAVGSA